LGADLVGENLSGKRVTIFGMMRQLA